MNDDEEREIWDEGKRKNLVTVLLHCSRKRFMRFSKSICSFVRLTIRGRNKKKQDDCVVPGHAEEANRTQVDWKIWQVASSEVLISHSKYHSRNYRNTMLDNAHCPSPSWEANSSKNSTNFMELEDSLPCSQQPTTELYHKEDGACGLWFSGLWRHIDSWLPQFLMKASPLSSDNLVHSLRRYLFKNRLNIILIYATLARRRLNREPQLCTPPALDCNVCGYNLNYTISQLELSQIEINVLDAIRKHS
jgi:hypothetical protein